MTPSTSIIVSSLIKKAPQVRESRLRSLSASVVARTVVGLTVDEVNDGAEIMTAILKEKTPPPSGPWSVLEPFLPVADFRSRHNSALLPFEALQRAIAELDLSLDESTPVTISTEPVART